MRLGIAAGLALLGACAPQPTHQTTAAPVQAGISRGQSADPAAYGAEVQRAYARVRTATAPYRTLDAAVKAGYPATVAECLSDESHGGMGYHHVNPGYVDARLEVERPEILLYEKRTNGTYVLNGVEYIVPYRLWPRDSIPPKIMGRELAQSDGLRLWYMHMWVWKRNNAGLFANWNPAVKCVK